MNKLIIGFLFSFFAVSGMQDDQVWIKANIPYNVHAGDRFTVEITVNKLDLQHFAELKQKLPDGFRALEGQSGAADFSFNKQMVKFTWLRLPRAAKIKVIYDIVVDRNLKGEFNLPTQFTYIYKNQRGSTNLQDDRIRVYAPGEVFSYTPRKENNNSGNNMTGTGISFPPKNPMQIQCLRIKPTFSKEQNGLIVKLLVSRGTIQSASRIEETIPVGYSANLISSKGATFSFDNNKVEFIWRKMPKEQNFEISYKLSPVNVNVQAPVITGEFAYFNGGSLQSSVIQQVDNNLKKEAEDLNKKDVMNFFND